MKSALRIGAVLAAMLMPAAAAAQAQQHEGHTVGSPAAVSAEVVSTCLNAQQRSVLLMDAINQRSEASRQTNSAGELRAAMADIQRALLDVRTELGRCAALEQAAAMPAPTSSPAAPAAPVAKPAPPAPADPHAGRATPAPSAAKPGASRATAPAPQAAKPAARAPADPHAGHVMPDAPAAPRAKPAARAAAPSSPAAKPAPAAADPHAGHAMPTPPSAPAAKPAAPAAEAARQPDLVEDPVSKTKVDPKTALRVLYQGKMYYFRSDKERREFMKHPGKYVSAK